MAIRSILRAWGLVLIFGFTVAPTAGCGSNKVQLSGQVMLDGVPLADGSVNFLQGDVGVAVAGATITNGSFKARLPPGVYKVRIMASRAIPGKTVAEMNNAPVLESIIPAKYNSDTTLSVTVGNSTSEVSFALESK